MKISTKIGLKSFFIYTDSLGKKTDKEAYLDLMEAMAGSSQDDSSNPIDVKGNNIASLSDEELIRIGKIIIKQENLSEYYDQLTHKENFFYEFKETYNLAFKKAVQPLHETLDKYETDIAQISNQYSGIMEAIKTTFTGITTAISSVAASIDIELLRKKVTKAERFNHIAIELNWFPTAVGHQLSVNDIINIVTLYDSEGKEKARAVIDGLFIQLYSENEINRLYVGWEKNTLLRNRLPILREVIDAHLGKHFNASICTILPQIEGIIRDRFPTTVKYIPQEELKKKVAAIVDNRDFNQATKNFYFKFILHNFYHGDVIPVLSRHAILHGEDTNFGTEVKSLKLILLFDFLQQQIAEHTVD